MPTAPALTITGQQSGLSLAISMGNIQAFVTEPLDVTLCTEVIKAQNFATSDPTIQDMISCDGRNLAGHIFREWRGAFSIDIPGTSKYFAWAAAMAFGAASAPSVVGASNAVFTETVTATGGTRRLRFDGKPTAALAWNANAAAIQAGVDAVIGSGRIVVTGAGPYVYTAAGAYLNTEVRQPTVSTLKLTGGTSAIVTTTPGGPARSSYTITQDDTSDQPPATTAVLGYPNGKAWALADLVVNEFTPTLEDDGSFLIKVSFMWSGLWQLLPSFSWGPCARPKLLDLRDSRVLIGAADYTSTLKAVEYKFSNRPQPAFATVSKFAQAYLRTLPLENEWTASFAEDPSAAASVYSLAVANGQDGTNTSFTMRYGSASDGATFANPESNVRLGNTAQDYGGDPAVGRVPIIVRPFDSDSSSTKPTSLTVVTDYAGGLLAAA